ncbi:MAG: hypothetical protein COA44_13755 [Arcobacter sp.]|nr:MAG: hypothetical protein COA44_13755 [Arcobacter sp.]
MCNIGKIDRIIRAILGLGLLAAAALTPYWYLSIVGAIALGTSLISFCPLYMVLRLNTGCKAKDL